MPTGCERFSERLGELLEGDVDAGLSAHVASCPSCREALEGLRGAAGMLRAVGRAAARVAVPAVGEAPAPARRWMPWALAASLLLAIGGWALMRGKDLRTEARPDAPSLARLSAGTVVQAAGSGQEILWQDGSMAWLAPGSRALLGEGAAPCLSVESGRVWGRLEGASSLRLPWGELRGAGGMVEILVEVEAAGPGLADLFLGRADAASSGRGRLAILLGQARWTGTDGSVLDLSTSQALLLEGGRPSLAGVTEADRGMGPAWLSPEVIEQRHSERLPAGGWRLAPQGGVALLSVRLPAPAGYLWEAELERPAGQSTVGVVFRSKGELRQWILTGEPGREGKVRVGVEVWGGRLVARVAGRKVWSAVLDAPALGRFSGMDAQGDLGIVGWGEPLEISAMRWRPLSASAALAGSGG